MDETQAAEISTEANRLAAEAKAHCMRHYPAGFTASGLESSLFLRSLQAVSAVTQRVPRLQQFLDADGDVAQNHLQSAAHDALSTAFFTHVIAMTSIERNMGFMDQNEIDELAASFRHYSGRAETIMRTVFTEIGVTGVEQDAAVQAYQEEIAHYADRHAGRLTADDNDGPGGGNRGERSR